ncbi:MAG: hypothetical protein PVH19_13960, partial [Planctomycetia bacterium]
QYCCLLDDKMRCLHAEGAECMGPDDTEELRRCIYELQGTAGRGCRRDAEVCCITEEPRDDS